MKKVPYQGNRKIRTSKQIIGLRKRKEIPADLTQFVELPDVFEKVKLGKTTASRKEQIALFNGQPVLISDYDITTLNNELRLGIIRTKHATREYFELQPTHYSEHALRIPYRNLRELWVPGKDIGEARAYFRRLKR